MKITIQVRPGARFWSGAPVTAQDVVFSLERNLNPHIAGFYASAFDRVKSITATGSSTVVIELKRPDYWLAGELSAMPGVVAPKSTTSKPRAASSARPPVARCARDRTSSSSGHPAQA